MSFAGLLNKTASVSRLSAVGDKQTYGAVGSFACHLQQTTAEEASFVEGVFGKTFKLYGGLTADVQVTDEVTIDSIDYKVKAIKDLTFGNLAHKEIILVLPDA